MIDFNFLFEAIANGAATALWFVALSKLGLLPIMYIKFPEEDE